MTSDKIMHRVSELVELAKKAATMNDASLAASLAVSTSFSKRADEATKAFFEAFEAFEKEVAEPLATRPLDSPADGRRTYEQAITEAKTARFGDAQNERLDDFLSCEAFENRMDPDNRARAFRLAAQIVNVALR